MDCCDLCGDTGVAEAIVTCSQCKINCEHTYCMRNPVEDRIDAWVCEECDTGGLHNVSRLHKSVEVQHSGGLRSKREIKVATGKTKYLTTNEAIRLSSGDNKPLTSANVTRHSKPSHPEIGVRVSERTPIKARTVSAGPSREGLAPGHVGQPRPRRLGNMETSKKNQPKFKLLSERAEEGIRKKSLRPSPTTIKVQSPPTSLKPSQAPPTHKNSQEEKSREVQSPQIQASRLMKMTLASPSPNASPSTISGGTGNTTTELRNSNAENVNTNILPGSHESSFSPALDALWKGNFRIEDVHRHGQLNYQFQAQPPSKVRRKIYEFSKKMPEELDFQIVPRKEHWNRLFKEIIPDEKDVGLYFFPGVGERSESYISLVESISVNDSALKNQIGDVELLVFTSKLLAVTSQRWEGEYFLWGVFHRLKASDHCNEMCRNEVDMEIDMVSGVDVGRKDVVVNKRLPFKERKRVKFEVLEGDDLPVPPGFEKGKLRGGH